jgi:hypothetical protein
MASGLALRMRAELAALMRRHNVTLKPQPSIPLAPETACSQILQGLAMTTDVDQERTRIRGFAFGLLSPRRIRLLHRHNEAQIAGEIEDLSYDEHGRLKIRCRVDHEQARRCGGFSVSARVNEYRLRDVDTPNFFAEVTDATLDEISLTSEPANSRALVRSRFPIGPHVQFYKNMEAYVDVLKKLAAVLPQLMVPTPSPPAQTAGSTMRKDTRGRWPAVGDNMTGGAFWSDLPKHPPSKPKSRTSFGAVADHLRTLEA